MSQDQSTSDLNTIVPTKHTLTIDGTEVQIKLIQVKVLPQVLKAVQPFAGLFKNGVADLDITSLLIHHTGDVVELTTLLTDQPQSWVEERKLDEMIELFTKVVEVNLDFFIKKVLPLLYGATAQLAGGLKAALPTNGLPSSSN